MIRTIESRTPMVDYWNPRVFLSRAVFIEPLVIPEAKGNYPDAALRQDLGRLKAAWQQFQSSRDREAVYDFLTEVFELVAWWAADRKADSRSRRALRFRGIEPQEGNIEPYAALISAAAYPDQVDRRAVSKWSQALRYAADRRVPHQLLRKFIQAKGGLNKCVAKYRARLRRQRQKARKTGFAGIGPPHDLLRNATFLTSRSTGVRSK